MPVMAAVGDNGRMAIRVSDTQAKAQWFALLDAVSAGEAIEITRDGRLVARIVHVTSPLALRGALAGARQRPLVLTMSSLRLGVPG